MSTGYLGNTLGPSTTLLRGCYGQFKCPQCDHQWSSANMLFLNDSMNDCYRQTCPRCYTACYPKSFARIPGYDEPQPQIRRKKRKKKNSTLERDVAAMSRYMMFQYPLHRYNSINALTSLMHSYRTPPTLVFDKGGLYSVKRGTYEPPGLDLALPYLTTGSVLSRPGLFPGAGMAGLAGTGLAGAGLAGAGLAGAGLAGTGLAGAGLSGAGLSGAGLSGAGLSGLGLSPRLPPINSELMTTRLKMLRLGGIGGTTGKDADSSDSDDSDSD